MAKKSEKAKEKFINVTAQLFKEEGYSNVSVNTICKKAGKAKGLFFYYFEKKENIVKVIIDRQVKKISEDIAAYLSDSNLKGMEKMRFLMNALVSKHSNGPKTLDYLKDKTFPDWVDSYSHEIRDKYIFPIILKTVHDGSAEGVFKYCNDSEVEIIYFGISTYMHRYYSDMANEETYRQSVEAISSILESALGCKKGTIKIS
jgi:AcrR family transcriptional regulator